MFPQSKLDGLYVAWGRGKWEEIEPGRSGYTFAGDDSFGYLVNPQTLQDNGISEEDILDCVEQIEDQLGAPGTYRTSMGLFPASGITHPGIFVRSRTNSHVMCHFSPTSTGFQVADGYFEWFFSKHMGAVDDMGEWLRAFDAMSGSRTTNVTTSPIVVPTYGEASMKAANLSESAREIFLQKVWDYHRASRIGHKRQLREDILKTWNGLTEGQDDPKPRDILELLKQLAHSKKDVYTDLSPRSATLKVDKDFLAGEFEVFPKNQTIKIRFVEYDADDNGTEKFGSSAYKDEDDMMTKAEAFERMVQKAKSMADIDLHTWNAK